MRKDKILKATVVGLIFFLLAGSWPAAAQGDQFAGGDGTAEDPYQIQSAEQLAAIIEICNCNHHFVLIDNIDLAGWDWTPIGNSAKPFKGTFDGNDKTISNLTISEKNMNDYGLFGYAEEAVIQNVRLANVQFDVDDDENNNRSGGALAGRTKGTVIDNVEVDGTLQSSLHYTGGLVGQLVDGSALRNSSGNVAIASSWNHVGGLVGSVDGSSSITGSSFNGSVQGDGLVGGIAGLLEGTVADSMSDADVAGSNSVGGLAGSLRGSSVNVTVHGAVYGEAFVGGLAGQLSNAHVADTNVNMNKVQRISGTQNTFGILAGYSFGTHVFEGVIGIHSEMVILDQNDQPLDLASLSGLHEVPDTPGGEPDENFQGGDGTEENPYLIATAAQLDVVRAYLDEPHHFKLVDDIDLTFYLADQAEGWVPIGSNEQPFKGHFDGSGHVIHGLHIHNEHPNDPQGLFSYMEEATVKHVHLNDVNVDVIQTAGAFAGKALNSTLTGISASGTVRVSASEAVNPSTQYTGGLVGEMKGTSELNQAISWVHVSGIRRVGGAVGETSSYTPSNPNGHLIISDVKTYGSVTGDIEVGGLIGSAMNITNLQNAKSYGNVFGKGDVGGLIGYLFGGPVDQVKAYGSVHGEYRVGGLFGSVNPGAGGIQHAVAYGGQIIRISGSSTSFGHISGTETWNLPETVTAHPAMSIIDQASGSAITGTGHGGNPEYYHIPEYNSADLADIQLDGQTMDREEDTLFMHWVNRIHPLRLPL